MAFEDVLNSHAAAVFLNPAHFGRTWIRWPASVPDAEEVTAIFEPRSPTFRDADIKGQLTEGVLHVPYDQAIDQRDTWISPEGEAWSAKVVGTADDGIREIELVRASVERTRRGGKRF